MRPQARVQHGDVGLAPLRSKKFVICAQVGDIRYSLFQVIMAGPKHGGFYLQFPYFSEPNGLVGIGTLPPGTRGPINLDLGVIGNTASSPVKYSHPLDGQAHFSQSGRVLTRLWNRSRPLDGEGGHIFSIQLTGLDDFQRMQDKDWKPPNAQRTAFVFQFAGKPPVWLKFVGEWRRMQDVVREMNGDQSAEQTTPAFEIRAANGETTVGVLLAPLENNHLSNYTLSLSCRLLPWSASEAGSMLTFIGGFDYPATYHDLEKPSKMLAFKYPAHDFNASKASLPSIDYIPADPLPEG